MTSEKRVVIFNHFAVPYDQPGGTRHVELFSRLPGWSYTIIASRLNLSTGKPQQRSTGFVFVPVTPYQSNGAARILNWVSYAVTSTIAAIRLPRPDVVYASSPHLLAALAGWLVARLRGSRFVLEIRDLWPRVLVEMGLLTETSPAYRVLHRLEMFLYARAERVVVLAPGAADALEKLGIAREKITYIPNAADPEDFVPTADRETLRERYGFTQLTGVYAGAHGPANGLNLLLDAAANLQHLPIDIVLVGSGVQKSALVARAKHEDLAHVRFMDPISKSEIPDLLAAADFGLHVLADVDLFRTAISPNKVFDYMAAGLCVVTNTPGIVADIVKESGAGISVAPDRLTEALVTALETGSSDLNRLGSLGRSWVRREQSRSAMARLLLNILNHQIQDGRTQSIR
jgi:glycosyltransferase involved in cell wall biosynthesis